MKPVLVIVGVALLLRVGLVLATTEYAPVYDAADYDRIAATLAEAGTWPATTLAEPGGASAYRPPAYPGLLAAVYELSGQRYTAARLVNALLGALAVLLLYLVTARLFGRRLGLWSAGVLAVTPPLIWLCGSLLSENLFIPLMLGTALCVAAYRDRPRIALAAGAGVLLGLATLTRSNALILALPVLLVLRSGGWRAPATALATLAIVLTPWTVRNASEFGRFLPLGTQSGYTMAGQWNAPATAEGIFDTYWLLPQTVPGLADRFGRAGIDEGELDADLRARAVDFAAGHPGAVLTAAVTNTGRTFDLGRNHTAVARLAYEELGVAPDKVGWLRLSTYLLLAAALAGLALRARRITQPWFWAIPALIFAASVPWSGTPRYAMPLYPFLAIGAAAALRSLARR